MREAAVQNSSHENKVVIEITGLNKWYGKVHVLKDIDLKITEGERIVVCGRSGSGKSTLLRCINRLEDHEAGQIIVQGVELSSKSKRVDKVLREVGTCFQHFNLFPHLTVLENCTLAPVLVRRLPKKKAENRFLPRASIRCCAR